MHEGAESFSVTYLPFPMSHAGQTSETYKITEVVYALKPVPCSGTCSSTSATRMADDAFLIYANLAPWGRSFCEGWGNCEHAKHVVAGSSRVPSGACCASLFTHVGMLHGPI